MTQMKLNLYGTRKTSWMSHRERENKGDNLSDEQKVLYALKDLLKKRDRAWSATEIMYHANELFKCNLQRNNVASRLASLRRKGYVKEYGDLHCPFTLKLVIGWVA